MKFFWVASVLASVALVRVSGASLYDDRDAAIKAVNEKFEEVKKLVPGILSALQKERDQIDREEASRRKDSAKPKTEERVGKVAKEVVEATRSAIARGKPLAAVDCIVRTSLEGNKTFENGLREYKTTVDDVMVVKESVLEVLSKEANLISAALEGLRAEAVKKIGADAKNAEALKKDALKKAQTGEAQLKEMKNRTHLPLMKEAYDRVEAAYEKRLQEVEDALVKRLQKCIA